MTVKAMRHLWSVEHCTLIQRDDARTGTCQDWNMSGLKQDGSAGPMHLCSITSYSIIFYDVTFIIKLFIFVLYPIIFHFFNVLRLFNPN